MKNIVCRIPKGDVFEDVYRVTANAAQQSGNALRVATEDNRELLEVFYREVRGEVVMVLFEFAYADEEECVNFSLPENWDSSLEKNLSGRLRDSMLYGVLARWYALSGDSIYGAMFEGVMEEIAEILHKRVKPSRI